MAHQTAGKIPLLQVILIVILGFIIYADSLRGDFIWDDAALVRDNAHIKSRQGLGYIFKEDIAKGAGARFGFYRPLQMASYALDHSLWKLNVFGYHLTNIFLHIAAALAIYWLVSIISRKQPLAFLTAVYFIVHPVHSEAVAYISGRADSLSALFILLCLIFYIKRSASGGNLLSALLLISYILALLSKEYSLITPLLLLLYSYSFKKKVPLGDFLLVAGASLLYVAARLIFFRFPAMTTAAAAFSQRLVWFFAALAEYFRLLVLPFDLHMEYGLRPQGLVNLKAMLGLAIFLFSIILCLRTRKGRGIVFFSVAWFYLTLLPNSNLYPLNAYMAEHWLYLPLLGFALILADLELSLYNMRKMRFFACLLIAACVFFYSFLTMRQCNWWKDKDTFYNRALRYSPASARLYNNLCKACVDSARDKEAVAFCEKAIAIKPDYAAAYQNLGNAYKNLRDDQAALAAYEQAIKLDAGNALVYNSLAVLYNASGNYRKAIGLYKKALELNPDYADAYYNLGNTYGALKNAAEAISCYKKAIEADPHNAHADAYYNNLATMYASMGETGMAAALYEKALKINPASAAARGNLDKIRQER